MKTKYTSKKFGVKLLIWHQDVDRRMPWKETEDPYLIWISEIILQQTRVAQGMAYYNRFIESLPTVKHLAKASEDDVLSLWKGLGYYARARNLHHAAKQVMDDFAGVFPRNYEDILSLKGIGPYTAAAIASFAYNLPYAVVDGNVYRVLSRYFGVETPIDSSQGKKLFAEVAQKNLDVSQPGSYNQAIMDFGALQCTPVSPSCHDCSLKDQCRAFKDQIVDLLPIKEKSIIVKDRYFAYLLCRDGDKVWMHKRTSQDIWKGLYELPLIEYDKPLSKIRLKKAICERYGLIDIKMSSLKKVWEHKQRLTHRLIHGSFYEIDLKLNHKVGRWVKPKERLELGVPKIIDSFFKECL